MNKNKILCSIVVPVLLLAAGNFSQAAPLGTQFTYQGSLQSGSAPANGNYDFAFALFNDPVAGAQVGATWTDLNVAVSNGLFTTTVDFGSGIFDGTAYWLAIGVRSNGSGASYTALSPRQSVTPSPYSLHAAFAPVVNDSISSVHILDGSITSSDLGPNSINSGHIINGQVANVDLANNAVNSAKVQDGSLTGTDLADDTVTSLQLANNIDIGASGVDGLLNVYNTSSGGPAISLYGNGTGGYQYLFQDDGQIGIYLDGDSGGGGLEYLYAADGSIGVYLDGESGGAGYIGVLNTNGSTRLALDGSGSGFGGQVSVYAADGSSTVQIYGDSSAAGLINVNNNVSQTRVAIDGQGNASGGQINVYASDGGNGITLYGDSGGGGLQYLYAADGSLGVVLDGDSGGAGYIGVRNTNGSTRLALDGQSTAGGGEISVYDASGTETVEILGQYDADQGARISMKQDNGVVGILMEAEYGASGEGGAVTLNNGAGNSRLRLEGDFNDAGDATFSKADGTLGIRLIGGTAQIGIGRTPTVNALEVNGNASKTTAGSWLANSDGRIKTDVHPVTHALDKIAQVQPVAFRYTSDYRAEHPEIEDHDYLNVIAQDFQKVFPEWVKDGGDTLPNGDKILQVDTYPLTIYSAAAIKELSHDLKAKQTEITELRQTVNELKDLVDGMNRRLNGGVK